MTMSVADGQATSYYVREWFPHPIAGPSYTQCQYSLIYLPDEICLFITKFNFIYSLSYPTQRNGLALPHHGPRP